MLSHDRKVILIVRSTPLEDLIVKHQTYSQAKFYIEHLGQDIRDYEIEHEAYMKAKESVMAVLENWGRFQVVNRAFLPNFLFGEHDIVVTLGQDGLVANTLKYLAGQPLVGLNPLPSLYDGILLPFHYADFKKILADVAHDKRECQSISMVQADLSDGQKLYAVNDLFIGPKTHTSARYALAIDGQKENQSSSGIIVATGLGSTGWMKSIATGAMAIALQGSHQEALCIGEMSWNSTVLQYAVREPFPSLHSSTNLVAGKIAQNETLQVTSQMADYGVIFSDGIEQDFLEFKAGVTAEIHLADKNGYLVV